MRTMWYPWCWQIMANRMSSRTEAILLEEIKKIQQQNIELTKTIKRVETDVNDGIRQLEKRLEVMEEVYEESGTSSANGIPMMIVQDIFDGQLKDSIEPLYSERVWSAVSEELKDDMREKLINALLARDLPVPKEKELNKRLRSFYSSRRNVALTRMDNDKYQKRRHSLKANRRTFTARRKAVAAAIKDGRLDVNDENEVRNVKRSVKKFTTDDVSPPLSDDEETRHEKMMLDLEKARGAKNLKRKSVLSTNTARAATSLNAKKKGCSRRGEVSRQRDHYVDDEGVMDETPTSMRQQREYLFGHNSMLESPVRQLSFENEPSPSLLTSSPIFIPDTPLAYNSEEEELPGN